MESLAGYLLDRFLGPYLEHKIDLKQEGTQIGVNTFIFNDIGLRCERLNESLMGSMPMKFLKYRIGQMKINIKYTSVKVRVELSDLQIDLIAAKSAPLPKKQPQPKEPGKKEAKKDGHLVDRLFYSKLLKNIEFAIKNVAIRFVMSDKPVEGYAKPTLLFRLKALSLLTLNVKEKEVNNSKEKVGFMQRFFGNKQLSFSDISVHLMKDQWLDLSEEILEMQRAGHFSALSSVTSNCAFPFDYPFLNHPSTIALIKSPKNADVQPIPLLLNECFVPSMIITFRNTGPKSNPTNSTMKDFTMPFCEVILSITQVKVLHASFQQMFLESQNDQNAGARPRKQSQNNPHDLMRSVLDFQLIDDIAGIEQVDGNELNDEELLEDANEISEAEQPSKPAEGVKDSNIHTLSFSAGQLCFTLICNEETEGIGSDRIFKAMGVPEFVPVGSLKCPWYDFGATHCSYKRISVTDQEGEKTETIASVAVISLKRFDFEERKAKVQLGGNFKQTNPLARNLKQQQAQVPDESDDQSNFQSCISNLLASDYQLAQEFNESMDGSVYFDAELQLDVGINNFQRVKSNQCNDTNANRLFMVINNDFKFQQLTNVLRFTDIQQSIQAKGDTELHLCSKTILDIAAIQGDQSCFTLKKKKSESSETTKVAVGKLFVMPSLHEVVLALVLSNIFAKPPQVREDEEIYIPNLVHLDSSNVSQEKAKSDVSLTVDAVELTVGVWHQMASNAALMGQFRQQSPIQERFWTIGCSCGSGKTCEQSLVDIIIGRVEFRSMDNGQTGSISRIELNGAIGADKTKALHILAIEQITANIADEDGTQNHILKKGVSLTQIVEEMKQEERKVAASDKVHEFVQSPPDIDLIASKSSEQQLLSGLNKVGIFDVESPTTRPEISIARINLRFEQEEIKQLASFAAMQEMFVKTVLNLVDMTTIDKFERLVPTGHRKGYFDQKRRHKGKPLALLVNVDDLCFQVFGKRSSKGKKAVDELIRARFHQVCVSLRMQDRGLLTNIRVGVRIQDMLVVDLAQTVCMNYFQGSADEVSESPRPRQLKIDCTFQEEIDALKQFLLLHPAYVRSENCKTSQDQRETQRHERKVLKAIIEIAFVNKSFFEERTSMEFISNKLELLKNQRPGAAIAQLATDFSDLKTNPMQLRVQCSLQNIILPLSNQNVRLQAKLRKFGKELSVAMSKVRDPNVRDVVKDAQCQPPKEFALLEKQRFDVEVQDVTILYAPILGRKQAENILFAHEILVNALPDIQDTRVRMPYSIALQINKFKFKSNRSVQIGVDGKHQSLRPKAKHTIDSQSIVLHFLHRQAETIWSNEIVQGKSLIANMQQVIPGFVIVQDDENTQAMLRSIHTTTTQELSFRGYIPLLSLMDTRINARSNCFNIVIGSLTVSVTADSLKHFMDFCKLVQFSISDELKQLEQFEDEISELTISQSDILAVSAYARFEQQQALKLSVHSQQIHKADTNKLAQPKDLIQSQLIDKGETLSCNNTPFFSKEVLNQSDLNSASVQSQKTFDEVPTDIFIVDGEAPHGQAVYVRKTNNPFSKSISPPSNKLPASKPVNIEALIDYDYFGMQSGLQMDDQRFRRIHQREFEPETKDKFCSFEYTFELSSIIVQVHAGKDFDFDTRPAPRRTFEGLAGCKLLLQSVQKVPQPFSVDENFFATTQSLTGQVKQQLIADIIQSLGRRRHQTRKSTEFLRLQLQDLLLSRRQYPDKVLMQLLTKEKQLRQDGKQSDLSKAGKKLKTLAISLRTLQVQHSLKGHKLISLFNHPYHFRFHNIFEFKDYSERSYQENVDEHQITIFLRPTHIQLSQEPIDFLITSLPKPSAQQIIQDQQDFILLEHTIHIKEANQPPKDQTNHVVKHLVIKESSLTISVAGVFSKFIQVRDLTLELKEFKLNCLGIAKPQVQFYSDVLDDSIQLVTDDSDEVSLPFSEAVNRVVFFYKNDIVANQKLAILTGFRPIQAIQYAGGSLLSPLYKPLYKAYHLGYLGFVLGLGEGVQDFVRMMQAGGRRVALIAIRNAA